MKTRFSSGANRVASQQQKGPILTHRPGGLSFDANLENVEANMAKPVPPESLTPAELAEARELDRRLCDAMGRKDLDAVMACFWDSPDLVAVIGGILQKGPQAVRSGIKQIFDQNESVKLQVDDVTYLQTGDGVIGVGTATFDLKPVNGQRHLMVERWSDLRRKIDGRWVYVLDHTTVVPE
jgi:uncharacterized protein (TIGR02246 family)